MSRKLSVPDWLLQSLVGALLAAAGWGTVELVTMKAEVADIKEDVREQEAHLEHNDRRLDRMPMP